MMTIEERVAELERRVAELETRMPPVMAVGRPLQAPNWGGLPARGGLDAVMSSEGFVPK